MSAMEPLYNLIKINSNKFSKKEIIVLEAELFVRTYEELKKIFRESYKEYFRLLKFTKKNEKAMIENNFTRLILQDILSTEEYTLQGIARYTDTHEDVVQEVIDGRNTSPSAIFLRRIIELHRSIRRDLYQSIMKKITSGY